MEGAQNEGAWYFYDGCKLRGPVPRDRLTALVRQGVVSPAALATEDRREFLPALLAARGPRETDDTVRCACGPCGKKFLFLREHVPAGGRCPFCSDALQVTAARTPEVPAPAARRATPPPPPPPRRTAPDVASRAAEMACPSCGGAVEPDYRVCPACGEPLDDQGEPPPVPYARGDTGYGEPAPDLEAPPPVYRRPGGRPLGHGALLARAYGRPKGPCPPGLLAMAVINFVLATPYLIGGPFIPQNASLLNTIGFGGLGVRNLFIVLLVVLGLGVLVLLSGIGYLNRSFVMGRVLGDVWAGLFSVFFLFYIAQSELTRGVGVAFNVAVFGYAVATIILLHTHFAGQFQR